MNKIANYLQASMEEMKKVAWPTKKETYNYTILVIGFSVAVALFLGGLDYLFNYILSIVINR